MKQRIPYLMVCCLFLLSLVGGILPTLSARAAGGTVSFTPVADAFVNQAYSSTNYGTSESLRVDNSPLTHSYLRFEVKGLNGAPVTAAKLRVYANSSNSTGYIVSQVSNTSWGEKTINYSNAPALGSQIKTSSGFSGGNWTEVDVSSYVRAEGTYSFGLSTQSDTSTNLASREDTTHPPALIVSVSTTSPTIAPTGSSTAAATAAPTTASISPQGSDPQPSFPIRAAFYYPWFPQAWTQLGIYPYTNYNPTLGFYSNADLTTVKQHINMMQYANIQAGIASWWGQGSQTDSKIAGLLSAASGTSFRWALYYEPEGQGNPSSSQIQNDLTYIRDHYGKDPSYLRVGGKFVIFVYADATDACGMADRWKAANTVGAYVVLKVFPGYGSCASQPDSWHQYSPAVATDQQGSYSYTISPGFWKKGQSVRLARDLTRWTSNVKSMAASGTKWQLVTTFSEWGEGTAVEPAKEWASSSGYGQYLDVLHANGSGSVPATVPTSTAAPTQGATSQPTTAPTASQPAPTATTPGSTQPAPTPTAPAPTPAPTQSSGGTGGTVLVLAGDNAYCSSTGDAATAALIAKINPVAIQLLGDTTWPQGAYSEFVNCYDPTWGKWKSITHPGIGNHEYLTAGAAGYQQYFGAAAGPAGKFYYSYDLGGWHIVVINSNCSQVGGCQAGSPQETWLKADLAAHPNKCTLAVWHHPRFSSGEHGDQTSMTPIWQDLYDAKADLVMDGHDHDYERFAPQTPTGALDTVNGIREFVVGTGGINLRPFYTIQPNSQVRIANVYGVMKLTLYPGSYDFQFVPQSGQTAADSGSGTCH